MHLSFNSQQKWPKMRLHLIILSAALVFLLISFWFFVEAPFRSHIVSTKTLTPHTLSRNKTTQATTTTPLDVAHSSTQVLLSTLFSDIYVISIPHRIDRRHSMDQLQAKLSVKFTYIDAIRANNVAVSTIAEQVAHLRKSLMTSDQFSWPVEFHSMSVFTANSKLVYTGSDLWVSSLASSDSCKGLSCFASWFHISQSRQSAEPLTCAVGNRTQGPAWDASLPSYMLLTPPKIACWYSHVHALRKIAEIGLARSKDSYNRKDATLILEDDVDVERDAADRLHAIWGSLPPDWDVVFLGHCWSNESFYPAIANTHSLFAGHGTYLHPSYGPRCTHAYAVSQAGALNLLRHLRYPPFAYSRALDQAYAWLVLSGRIKSYSVVPSLIAQRKVHTSDIDGMESGMGSQWKDKLEGGILGG